jgi:hypothetical protein
MPRCGDERSSDPRDSRASSARVQPRALTGVRRLHQRFLNEGVNEPRPPAVSGRAQQQSRSGGGVERRECFHETVAGDRGGELDVELASHDGRGPQHACHLLSERRDARSHHLGQPRRELAGCAGVEQCLEEKMVAAGPTPEQSGIGPSSNKGLRLAERQALELDRYGLELMCKSGVTVRP